MNQTKLNNLTFINIENELLTSKNICYNFTINYIKIKS